MPGQMDNILNAKRDHSKYLYHFTKQKVSSTYAPDDEFQTTPLTTTTTTSFDVLRKIAQESHLKGTSSFIKGGSKCVCFTETPIYELARLMSFEWWDKSRYFLYGIAVTKEWLFDQGGRPVIYQRDGEETNLSATQNRHLHVTYSPGNTDFTWEREWRIKTGQLNLNLEATIFIVPTVAESKQFMNEFTTLRATSLELFL